MADPTQPHIAYSKGGTTSDDLARFKAALMTLPRYTRAVFLAHRMDDLSYDEIALRTGVSVQRVEREMARAIYGLMCAMVGVRPRKWWKRGNPDGGDTAGYVFQE